MISAQRLRSMTRYALKTWFVRLTVYSVLIFLFGWWDWSTGGLLLVAGLLLFKSFQLSAAFVWIRYQGAEATPVFRQMENAIANQNDLNREDRIRRFRTLMFDWLGSHEPGWAFWGLLDWRLRAPDSFVDVLRDYFFRFKTQAVFGSMVLIVAASRVGEKLPDSLSTWLLVVIGLLLVLNCFLMGGEILIGNALMGSGYSRYFSPDSDQLFTQAPHGKRYLWELWSFSKLAVTSLIVVAAVCSAYFVMFGGFEDLWVKVTASPSESKGLGQRLGSWLEFFYFATTTFCTVGFGDIHPTTLCSRVLVTIVHFLTFGYVLFLLQTLVGQDAERPPSDSSTGTK